jgi:hypothetical protein
MLKSMLSATAGTAAAPCCRCGCACNEDGRASCSCWAAGFAPDEGMYPPKGFYVLGRSPKPLEADFELPRGCMLDLHGACVRASFR